MTNQEKLTNKEIAHLLRSVSAAYLIKKENRFKQIAYDNAAEAVENLTRELKDIWKEGNLEKIEGIGKYIASYLAEYLKTGKSKQFQSAFAGIPESVFEMMKIPSVGPKKAFDLATKLKITKKNTAITKLEKAALKDKISVLDKFGTKSQDSILEGIKIFKKRKTQTLRMPLPYAYSQAMLIKEYLSLHKKIKKIEVLGSLRRMNPTIGDIDIAIQTKDKFRKEIIEYFLNYPDRLTTEAAGDNKASIIINSGYKVDVRLQDEKTWGTLLQYFTGSKAHNIRLREYAQQKSLSVSEHGIKEIIKGKTVKNYSFNNEKSFYNFLGLEYIPPEIREGTNEISIARQKKTPDLVQLGDIQGDFHLHSNYPISSSHDYGTASFSEIADKASQLNYKYLGFSDHNPKVSGLSEKQIATILKKRKYEIEKQMKSKKIKYFIGLEVDILTSGKLAVPKAATKYLDYMIVSIHSAFHTNVRDMTERVLSGLDNEKVKVLAHPTGRLLGKREGFELEWKKIFEFCKKKGIALEINSWPERLDLPDTLVRDAVDNKVKLIVNSDSHDNDHMDNMFYGISVARRGWAKKTDIINTYSYKEIKKWIRR